MAIVIIITSISFFSCGGDNDAIDENGGEELKYKNPIELLPRDNDISGWMRDWTFVEATNYASLYDLIDGAAQIFIDNGFVSAVFQNYTDGSGLQLELRIYEMDSEENAQRIYDELAPAAIISIAQQASPNVIGQMLDCRAQLIACSTVVVITFSSKRPSIHGRVI